MKIYNAFTHLSNTNKKGLAVLIDPDRISDEEAIDNLLNLIESCGVDFIFIGGSLVVEDNFEDCVAYIKAKTNIPIVLFPGSINQLSDKADALLFLSLISGRNPELLIGTHVLTAPKIKAMNLEAISTGYMLISCGKLTTANYISSTLPIPFNKPEIAVATAMAGEMLGLRCIYLDGGSGADQPISEEMIAQVKKNIDVPLIIGGGIRSASQANLAWNSGADIVVIGTAFENNPELLLDIASAKKKLISV